MTDSCKRSNCKPSPRQSRTGRGIHGYRPTARSPPTLRRSRFPRQPALIQKLPTTVAVATPTTTAPVPTVVIAAAWRRRRSPVLTAAVTSTVTAVIITAIIISALSVTAPRAAVSPEVAARASRTHERSTNERRSEKAKCFGFGGNGGSTKCEGCSEHDGYLAQFQIHDASLCFYGGEPALELVFANLDRKRGASWDLRSAILRYLATW